MANFEKFAGRLLVLEGGYVNNPADRGGPTKYGVILATWKAHGWDKDNDGDIDDEDIKKLTPEDAKYIAKKIFWDHFKADEIKNQSLAEFIVDWGYNSGTGTAARKLQQALGVAADGVIGRQTLAALNSANQKQLFEKLKQARIDFIEAIVRNRPDQMRFYDGWMNRVQKFFFLQAPKELV